MATGLLSDIFRAHGHFCARHPWEVIFIVLTATICFISKGMHHGPDWPSNNSSENLPSQQALDIVLMSLVRAVAILYSYQRLRSLHRSHSRFVLSLAGLFTVFSSFVFTCSVVNVLQSDLSDLKDALFFFLLLIDVVKACALAHWSLNCPIHNAAEVASCISQGLAVLGPAITLDTLVETLVIGIGTLSGVRTLEVLCCYGCMSAVVNYIVFMTFYPACLALVLELSTKETQNSITDDATETDSEPSECAEKSQSQWQQQVKLLKQMMALEQANPVVQRVKLIMAGGLMVVHAHCRWVFLHQDPIGEDGDASMVLDSAAVVDVGSEDSVLRWLSLRADQLVLLILVLALTVKFTFFDDRDHESVAKSISMQNIQARVSFNRAHSPSTAAVTAMPPLPSMEIPTYDHGMFPNLRPRTISLVVADEDDSDGLEFPCVMEDKETQTEWSSPSMNQNANPAAIRVSRERRSVEECQNVLSQQGPELLTDEEVVDLVDARHLTAHQLEKVLGDAERGVRIRRQLMARIPHPHFPTGLQQVPYASFDYSKVYGACCENVIGYVSIPLGYAGPLLVDDSPCYVPLATTEGCLVASTNRGCRALTGGVRTQLVGDGMSRGPVVRLPNIRRAADVAAWLEEPSHLELMKSSFNSTSRFAKLQKIRVQYAGRYLFLRFVAKTGDAMGMNMVSKGTEASLRVIRNHFPDLEVVSLSGNFCTDKKPAAVNWLEGRGKSVVAEAVVPASVVEKVLKTSVAALVDLNISKNLIGSSVAGSLGGYNAHAANIVTAIYIATGQDPAQVVTSSNCMTLMEPWGVDGRDLYISCTMPSLEVGTIGGGTGLTAQSACLEMLGVRGANVDEPGENACRLARIVCATVLAGELSLMAALAAGHLVQSHMIHNRSSTTVSTTTPSS